MGDDDPMTHDAEDRRSPVSYEQSVDVILQECRLALGKVDPQAVDALITAVLSAERIFFVGVGIVLNAHRCREYSTGNDGP